MYSYCINNPVNMSDPNGTCSNCARYWALRNPKPTWIYNPGGYGYGAYLDKLARWEANYKAEYKKTHATQSTGAATVSSEAKIDELKICILEAVAEMASKYNLKITITSGYRNPAEQQALWDSGYYDSGGVRRTQEGNPVVLPKDSGHCQRIAVDTSNNYSIKNFVYENSGKYLVPGTGLFLIPENTCYHLQMINP